MMVARLCSVTLVSPGCHKSQGEGWWRVYCGQLLLDGTRTAPGSSLKKPCDIYAFAMTLYEVGACYCWTENHESDLTHLKDFHK
jgi:hypothetical protein